MPEARFDFADNIAARVIVALLILALLLTLFSIGVVYLISHNIYAASYYTLSALFDANGESSAVFISSVLGSSGSGVIFYEFFAISVIDGLAKAVIIGFLIASFINLLSGIDLKSKLEVITAKHMRGHVIVCGYSMLAERLCEDLKKTKLQVVIVEKDPQKVNILRDLGFTVIEGDFTEKKTLENASIGNAKTVVFATESDFTNLLGVVTAHHSNPKVKIIARARSETSVRKMQRGGAELCLVPEVVAGLELGESIAKM
jgi:hypothetical protein